MLGVEGQWEEVCWAVGIAYPAVEQTSWESV